ncbi:MAG TPA: xanthine dehydrogenase family protein molybdopterin-binding subunit [Gammaproteobacteria bacterium]|nr:xanthine dehydrogenase family protein molybdopterin-binding subunit [Gammaproteobacteria bacterium]
MKISRRRFILSSAAAGGGVLIGYAATRPSRHRVANDTLAQGEERFLTSFLKIEPDNKVIVYVNHSEMGQGSHTALAMMAADELDAAWEDVAVEQAPATDLYATGDMAVGFAGEFDVPAFLMPLIEASAMKIAQIGNLQTTGGSASIRFTGQMGMRVAGAAARQMLIQCASEQWAVPASECTTALGYVQHNASGQSLSYGELADAAAALEPPAEPVLKDRSQFNIMGKAISRVDIPAKVDGSAFYGLDYKTDDMLFAAIRLAPVFGTKLVSVDASEALQRRGVQRVIELEDSVAVVADNYWRAKEALRLVKTEFESSDNDDISSADIAAQFDAELESSGGSEDFELGDAGGNLELAEDQIEASYRVPYLAHAPMEPMNCTVHLHDGIGEVWTSTQDPLAVRGRVASLAGLGENDVTHHPSYLGGGFGRRLPFNWNVIDHATKIAMEFSVPVKTVFSREDDMQQDYYRPAVTSNFKAGLNGDGKVIAWQNRYTGPVQTPGAAHIPYDIANQSIRYVDGNTHVPVAAWRSVDHSQQTFFTESFIDELAHRAGTNPFQFRMELLHEHPRHQEVLRVAAEAAGYGRNLPPGHALGLAVQESFGSICAEVAEVSIDANGRPIIHKVTAAIDCGWAVNPDTAEAQIESGIIFGLTAAMYGEITIENGRVAQNNFPDYEMVRMATSPEIDVHIVESGESLGGLGEPATPPIAAAVTNAIYILTGQRIRELPISRHDFSQGSSLAGG